MSGQYFLGVDGGQSRTTAMIADERGRVLGVGIGGPCDHTGAAEGMTKFIRAMKTCLEAACTQAGLDGATVRFASACLGFSGGPDDKDAILKALLRCDRMTVTHDALVALVGATAGGPGLITIAGTGSIAFGRNARSQTARAGGWGYLFGDEGGGFWIVREAMRAALRFEEGRDAPTSLRAALLQATGARDANHLLHRFYTTEFPRPRIAGLARLVDKEAENGDAAARRILLEAAKELAALACAVRRKLFGVQEAARITYAGGVFRSGIVFAAFRELLETEPGNRVEPPAYGPAAGALLEAYRIAGIQNTLSDVPEEKSRAYPS